VNDEAHDPDELLRDLLRRAPVDVEAALTSSVPRGFNWLGLGEVAAANALAEDAEEGALAWARVARQAYEHLASAAGRDRERRRFMTSLMRLRGALIRRHGPHAGHPFLDCDEVIDWFLVPHAGQYEMAALDAESWRELPIERVRALRDIKNEIAVLQLTDRCDRFKLPEVQAWVALRRRLP